MSKDYYKILGISKDASKDELKKAFRILAHKHHPDKEGGDEAKFKEINEAYQVLSDDTKRSQYDRFGQTFEQGAPGGFGGFRQGGFQSNINVEDLSEMFGDMFNFGGGGQHRGQTRQFRGKDIRMNMHVSFHEAAFGTERGVELYKPVSCETCSGAGIAPGSKMKTCGDCSGQGRVRQTQRTILGNFATMTTCHACEGAGNIPEEMCADCGGAGAKKAEAKMRVKIPAGINEGETLRVRGQGEAGMKGAPAGDLYARISINKDERFERDAFNVYTTLKVSFSDAALGAVKTIETLDGEIDIKVPSGLQSGEEIRLKGRGITRLGSSSRGDHYVRVHVETPTRLSRKAKRLLNDLRDSDR